MEEVINVANEVVSKWKEFFELTRSVLSVSGVIIGAVSTVYLVVLASILAKVRMSCRRFSSKYDNEKASNLGFETMHNVVLDWIIIMGICLIISTIIILVIGIIILSEL